MDGIDATGAPLMADPWLVIWGSPHPNNFSDIPALAEMRYTSNGAYKRLAFELLKQRYPNANIAMPHPHYYALDGAVGMETPCIRGVRYQPMASAQDSYLRLCTPEQTKVLAGASCVPQTKIQTHTHTPSVICLKITLNGTPDYHSRRFRFLNRKS